MGNENETQWESSDFDEQTEEQSSYDELDGEDSENDYSDDGENEEAPVNKGPLVIILLLIIVLVIVGAFIVFKMVSNKNAQKDMQAVPSEANQAEMLDESLAQGTGNTNSDDGMLSIGFSDDGGVTVTSTDTSNIVNKDEQLVSEEEKNIKNSDVKENENKNISTAMVAWNKIKRQNPFKPPVIVHEKDEKYETIGNIQFEIIEPPTTSTPDDSLTKLLSTQISGILYDEESPSAIVNISGKDQFVKVGDVVEGYLIKNITSSRVEISYKNNTYVASVGDLFTPGKLETQSDVVNLDNKFAGRYRNNY